MSRDTLTRIQQAALELIREHRPVYRYGPLTPSLNRPKPVKPGDLTPM